MIDPQLPDQGPPPVSSTTLRQFAGLWILIVGGLGCWEALIEHTQSGRFSWSRWPR